MITATEVDGVVYLFSLFNNAEFYILLTISLQILANNQLDALSHVFIYFSSLRVSSIIVIIIRRSNCINTSSGMISLRK